jgi:cytochrome c oxidase subunit II
MQSIRGYLRRALPLLLLPGVVSATLYIVVAVTRDVHGAAEKVVSLTVKRFEYSPRQVTLEQGVPVVLEITSLDVPHGFNVPDLGVRADVIPGRVTRVRLVPDRVGTFTFRCDIFCGAGHEDLEGEIVVRQ